MLRSVLFFLIVVRLFAQQQNSCPARPYTQAELMDVMRTQDAPRAEKLIRECGIDVFGEGLEAELKKAGAGEKLIAAARESVSLRTNPRDGQRYVYVPAGTFRMGCESSDDGACLEREKPAHEVRISKGFWMGQTEVTVEAYKRYIAATRKPMPVEPMVGKKKLNPEWGLNSLPMTRIDWNDVRDYCEWAGMRLPTEAEWEYAARGGTTGERYGALDDVAWYSGNSGDEPKPVGKKAPNAYQLYDMLGNVWEWTANWYGGRYAGDSAEVDPKGPESGQFRVLRGGAWFDIEADVRASHRDWVKPAHRGSIGTGFRCVGEVPAR